MSRQIQIPDLAGKIAIVTGGNRGMGFHIAQELVNRRAKVYLAARSQSSATEAIDRIEAANPEIRGKNKIQFLKLDLATLKGAKESAETFLAHEERLDILIHNAGVLNHPYAKTTDGLEDSMAVNHFGPFVFTRTLFDLLVSTSNSSDVRVVVVASLIHTRAPSGGHFMTIDEINDPLASDASKDNIIPRYARYARSKLANILFAKQLQKEFQAVGSSALAIAICPGGVATQSVLEDAAKTPMVGPAIRFLIAKLAKSPLDGALNALYAATSPDIHASPEKFAGVYLDTDRKIKTPSKDAQNEELARQLWDVTAKISDDILEK